MHSVLLVIHLIVALAIITFVLLQRSEGGGLGIGGSGGMGNFATPRATADFMTRATAFLGGTFFVTSLLLAIMAGQDSKLKHTSILDAEPSMTSPENAPAATSDPQNDDVPSVPMVREDGAAATEQAPAANDDKAPAAAPDASGSLAVTPPDEPEADVSDKGAQQ